MKLSRRDMLTAILGAPLGASLAACDRSVAPARPVPGTLVGPDPRVGHRLREPPPPDEAFDRLPRRTVDVAIVGGGPSGLAAAWRLAQRKVDNFELLELESEAGGTSASGRAGGIGFPWGAHYITRPLDHNRPLQGLLSEMGVYEPGSTDRVRENLLVREPKERLFYRGYFYEGLYPSVGATAQDAAEWERFQRRMLALSRMDDGTGRPAFAIPVRMSSTDPELLALDRLSAAAWLAREGFVSWRVRWMVDYACRDDYGLLAEDVSAWALVLYFAARIDPATGQGTEVITWPEGNGALVQHLSAAAAGRIRTAQLVMDVVPNVDGSMRLLGLDTGHQSLFRLDAKRVILAVPQFIAKRLVRPLRQATSDPDRAFDYGAWMVANLHLRARPQSRGCEEAWDNVLFDSPSLGYVSATHQRGRSFGPSVWTYYLPMTDTVASNGRMRLFQAQHGDLVDATLADLGRAHQGLAQHIERVDVCRWGHGMVQPRVGRMWDGARQRARQPVGAVHFAHSDLSGVALFEEAFDQGVRAADEVADALS